MLSSRLDTTRSSYGARIAHGSLENQGARVLDSSDVLGLLGFGNGSVNLADGKVIKGKADPPRMTAAQWKKAPEWLDNPAAVLDSDTMPSALVPIAPEIINGATVRMTVVPRKGAEQMFAY